MQIASDKLLHNLLRVLFKKNGMGMPIMHPISQHEWSGGCRAYEFS
jgi:hypothetical protein